MKKMKTLLIGFCILMLLPIALAVNLSDRDHDGVADNYDACPHTSNKEYYTIQKEYKCGRNICFRTVTKSRTIIPVVDEKGCAANDKLEYTDEDGDKVISRYDRCKNTPLNYPVDHRGCPIDSDRDKIVELLDMCPNTPIRETPDASGCSISQRDTDNDGIKDNIDKCINTPAGSLVSQRGCVDEDNDLIEDTNDNCKETPYGFIVDTNGCETNRFFIHDTCNQYCLDKCSMIISCTFSPYSRISPCDKYEYSACSNVKILDDDNDGIENKLDNCRKIVNAGQIDCDGDRIGDMCDASSPCSTDTDSDGVMDNVDNCISIANTNQANCDGIDGGDVCDPKPCNTDTDGDGINDNKDNCNINNPDQADCDIDGIGDACESINDMLACAYNYDPNKCVIIGEECLLDSDNDGVPNINDACDRTPMRDIANWQGCSIAQIDSDSDGVFDNVDLCPLKSGTRINNGC